jgi:hypothetical protein
VPDLSRREDVGGEIKPEGNLLIEAVSLLVQRQRETETWISEQLWQAEQRAADTEQRYAELASRLAGIESHLAQLVHEMEPGADDGRIARLRDQLQDLRRGEPMRASDEVTRPIPTPIEPMAEDRAPRSSPTAQLTSTAPVASEPRAETTAAPVPSQPRRAVAAAAAAPSTSTTNVTFWELLGSTRGDRFGAVMMGLGAVALLFVVLSQLRFG